MRLKLCLIALVLATLGCQLAGSPTIAPSPTAGAVPQDAAAAVTHAAPVTLPAAATLAAPTVLPSPTAAATPTLLPAETEYFQWAAAATASSAYGDPDWAAGQATGAPDTRLCGDFSTAWASAAPDSVEWLEVTFAIPAIPGELLIVHSYNPTQVVKVELIDLDGAYHSVYTGRPEAAVECPYIQSIYIDGIDVLVGGARITVDQSELGGWDEIDAVGLTGLVAEAPPAEPTPPSNGLSAEDMLGWTVFSNPNHVNDLALQGDTLWAATGGGVVAWDLAGEAATPAPPAKYTVLDGLAANAVQAITVCPLPEPRVIAGGEGGLDVFDPETGAWSPLALPDERLWSPEVETLDCDPQTGRLFVGFDYYLGIYDGKRDEWRVLGTEDGLASALVNGVAVVGADTWVASPFGVSVLHANGQVTAYTAAAGNIPDESALSIAVDAEGVVWLGTFDGLLKFQAGKWQLYSYENSAPFPFFEMFTSILPTPDGTLWIANRSGDLCEFSPEHGYCLQLYASDPARVTYISSLQIDEQGWLYIGGEVEGIVRFDGRDWQPLEIESKILSNSFNALALTPDGTLWAAGALGLQRIPALDPWGGYWATQDLGEASAQSLFVAADGLWVGHDRGATLLDFSGREKLSLPPGEPGQGLPAGVLAITQDSRRRVWLGTGSGLTVWDGQAFTYFDLLSDSERPGSAPRSVYSLLFDGQNVWAGTYDALFQIPAGEVEIGAFTRYDQDLAEALGVFNPQVNALAMAPGGRGVLIGLGDTLVKYENDGFDVLVTADAAIQSIAVSRQGGVWLGLQAGGVLYGSPDAELGLFWEELTTANGLVTGRFGRQSILIDPTGGYWFAGQSGGLSLLLPLSGG